jgi:hypothetical protein
MGEEEAKPAVTRRGLLRRASTVAAGVGVVAAASAAPALAADGDAIQVGGTYTGSSKTSLSSGDGTHAALKLANAASNGAPLELQPVDLVAGASPVSASGNPVGTTYVDRWGDVHVVGDAQVNAGPHYDLMLYSPTWAFMPVPVPPARIVSTYAPDSAWGRELIVPGSATYDSQGRVMPKNSNSVPDAIIDLSLFIFAGPAAIQGNLSAGLALNEGWASLWDEGDWPGNSSINFPKATWIANFTQTLLGADVKIRVKVSVPTVIVFDVSGFVVADPFAQLNFASNAATSTTGRGARAFGAPVKPQRGATPRR